MNTAAKFLLGLLGLCVTLGAYAIDAWLVSGLWEFIVSGWFPAAPAHIKHPGFWLSYISWMVLSTGLSTLLRRKLVGPAVALLTK